jgi:hypothetical protein
MAQRRSATFLKRCAQSVRERPVVERGVDLFGGKKGKGTAAQVSSQRGCAVSLRI